MTHPGGRPSYYRPEMPQEMLAMLDKGWFDTWIYAEWDICKDTFYRWLKEHPELKDAHEKGKAKRERYWDLQGIKYMEAGDNKKFNYWIAFMNRYYGWSKNQGAGDTTININQMAVFNQQTREELMENISLLLEDTGAADKLDGPLIESPITIEQSNHHE